MYSDNEDLGNAERHRMTPREHIIKSIFQKGVLR